MEALTRVINLAKKGQELLGDTEEGIDPSLFENKAEKELYQAVNDPFHLCIALSRNPNPGFQNKVNQAICYRLMCHYDDVLQ